MEKMGFRGESESDGSNRERLRTVCGERLADDPTKMRARTELMIMMMTMMRLLRWKQIGNRSSATRRNMTQQKESDGRTRMMADETVMRKFGEEDAGQAGPEAGRNAFEFETATSHNQTWLDCDWSVSKRAKHESDLHERKRKEQVERGRTIRRWRARSSLTYGFGLGTTGSDGSSENEQEKKQKGEGKGEKGSKKEKTKKKGRQMWEIRIMEQNLFVRFWIGKNKRGIWNERIWIRARDLT